MRRLENGGLIEEVSLDPGTRRPRRTFKPTATGVVRAFR
jgi:DNA-binding PadR family transcriptional regulator